MDLLIAWGHNMKRLAGALAAVLLLVGCADGSVLVTGKKHPPISSDSVTVYLQPPQQRFEVIGLVKAQSDAGMTQQGSLDYALDELKQQAASVGANGVLLQQTGSKSSGAYGMMSGGSMFMYSTDAQEIAGQAILVSK